MKCTAPNSFQDRNTAFMIKTLTEQDMLLWTLMKMAYLQWLNKKDIRHQNTNLISILNLTSKSYISLIPLYH